MYSSTIIHFEVVIIERCFLYGELFLYLENVSINDMLGRLNENIVYMYTILGLLQSIMVVCSPVLYVRYRETNRRVYEIKTTGKT